VSSTDLTQRSVVARMSAGRELMNRAVNAPHNAAEVSTAQATKTRTLLEADD
jgi:hypothetical protein